MLFKKIVTRYGKSLSGAQIQPEEDIIYFATDPHHCDAFRQSVLDDITGAKVYLLDGHAANYLDSFREDLGDGLSGNHSSTVDTFMREVELPEEVVWVEYDHRLLLADRFKRGHTPDPDFTSIDEFGLRGFLIDNRSADSLKVTAFRTDGRLKLIDPSSHLVFQKTESGKPAFSTFKVNPHLHMLEFFSKGSDGADEGFIKGILEDEYETASYDLAMPYVLFTLLVSPENGIVMEDKASLTPKEEKTARKFGKTWMTDALRSHVTIRIGKDGQNHLEERAKRIEHEKRRILERSAPVEHWVSEHERRYKNGKIVRIKAHKRGTKVDASIPTRVMGPKRD